MRKRLFYIESASKSFDFDIILMYGMAMCGGSKNMEKMNYADTRKLKKDGWIA